ncbi:uncharacterized protein LOC110840994, partial [Zootermopsis nevadensis]|uniref:uncharacterized protein LOC110840994 n=1 Tax=Zootermopsis nevadensis TaxID=136037 RepID=UPI000B8E4C91
MLCQQPIITHTVATPQDSPNTTLDSSMRDFNNRLMAPALYASSTSIDSIDRSMSSQHSIPGLLKPPNNKFTVNNLSQPTPTLGRRVSLVAVSSRRDTLPSTPRIQRVCSWKLSRPSLRRKSRCGGSEMGQQDQLGDHDIILNNNNILSPPKNFYKGNSFVFQRNERREREQRELAKQAQQAHKCEYSDHFSSFDGSRSSSSSESDSYTAGTQELKNRWRSAEELRKTDNGHCEKNSWKQKQDLDRDYEPKCNIQKESKMLCQQPIITHTVATPQDSPNTTLDSSMRDFNNRLMAPALYASSTSIDSIDRSM